MTKEKEVEINIRTENGVTIFDIQGKELVGDNSLALRKSVNRYLEEEAPETEPQVIFNLEQVHLMDTSALNIFGVAYTKVKKRSGRVVLMIPPRNEVKWPNPYTDPHQGIRNLIVINNLHYVFDLYETIKQALESFKS